MANEIVVSEQAAQFLPVMPMAVAVQRRSAIVEFTKQIMVRDTDYGAIPGTGSKPSLLKPGAEKLCSFFGLAPVFVPVESVQDWTGAEHGGEAFFLYRYRCELYRDGVMLGSGIGSCNSWESKYRYRKAERICPTCGQPAIIKGKQEYGGGWVCFKAKGGCGAKFKDDDRAITDQPVGRVVNPDPADIVNTIDKMAQKRALVAATLIAINASEFFTQDVEDMGGSYVDVEYTVTQVTQPTQAPRNGNGNSEPPAGSDNPFNGDDPDVISTATMKQLHAVGTQLYGKQWGTQRPKLVSAITKGAHLSANDLTEAQAQKLIAGMNQRIAAQAASVNEPMAMDMAEVEELAH